MAFDAFFLSAVLEEVRTRCIGARVEKIHQPARDTVIVHLRCQEGREKLLFAANPAAPRLHLTAASPENPAQPPMFCMLLRKHLLGAKLTEVSQPPMERAASFRFDCTDEMGFPVQKTLVAELMGRTCNLYLLSPEGRILDCLRRIGLDESAKRAALPGLMYQPPEPVMKLNLLDSAPEGDAQRYVNILTAPGADVLADRLMDTVGGLSPLVCREAALYAAGSTDARIDSLDVDTTADKLYFEPLTPEDVMNIIDFEKPDGVIASLGGQTAINLAQPLTDLGVNIIGTDCAAIEKAENRDAFEKLLKELDIPQPKGKAVTRIEDGVAAAREIGYPVLVRPSFVLGGRAMQIVANEEQLRHYLHTAVEIDADKPVLVDKYIRGKEVEIDAICDGTDVFVPGIMELVERTGVHSGDSISVYPSFSISDKVKGIILQYAKKLGLGIGIVGLFNVQFIVDPEDNVSVIEVNPRSSRTVPFLSKATGYSLADIATDVILGLSLKEQGFFDIYPAEKERWYVKAPVFSFNKIRGLDAYLTPEMKSTGEAIGYDRTMTRALYKALQASGMKLQNYGTVVVTLADEDKEEALPMVRSFYNMGFNIAATVGTAEFLKKNGIRTHKLGKISEGSNEILDFIRSGFVSYVINTRAISSGVHYKDGGEIRRCATENGVTIFTSLDTVRIVTEVLEEMTISVSTIDAE